MRRFFSVLFFCVLFCISVFSQKAEKIDEFSNPPCDEYLGRIDTAIIQALDNPSSTIYILIYEGREPIYNSRKNKTELAFPAYGSAEAKIRSIKKYLTSRKVPVKRFSFVKAGFRENFAVEIWFVPQGATVPEAAPTLTKMKYRKGRATGFCIDCCGL